MMTSRRPSRRRGRAARTGPTPPRACPRRPPSACRRRAAPPPVVRHVQHRAHCPGRVSEHVTQVAARHGRVPQAARHQQTRRPAGQGSRQRHPLPLAARQAGGTPRQQLRDAHHVRCGVHDVPRRGTMAGSVRDVASDIEVRKEQAVLRHVPDRPAFRRRVRHIDTVDADPSGVRRAEAGQRLQKEALAGPARAQKDDRLPLGHGQVHRTDDEAAHQHGEVADPQHGRGPGHHHNLGVARSSTLPRRRHASRRRTPLKRTSATNAMRAAAGRAAPRPNPSKRSNTSTGTTFGL